MKLLIAVIISIALFGTFLSSADEKTETEPPKVGDTAPDFMLQDVEEKEHNLKKLRGKVVFLIMGNRKIRKEDDKWAETIQKAYRKSCAGNRFYHCRYAECPWIHTQRFYQESTQEEPASCEVPIGLERGST